MDKFAPILTLGGFPNTEQGWIIDLISEYYVSFTTSRSNRDIGPRCVLYANMSRSVCMWVPSYLEKNESPHEAETSHVSFFAKKKPSGVFFVELL